MTVGKMRSDGLPLSSLFIFRPRHLLFSFHLLPTIVISNLIGDPGMTKKDNPFPDEKNTRGI
jgi:hypothetical protein